eukprot:507768_1
MNSSRSRDVQHNQSIYPLSVASQFLASEIFLKLWIPFAMIKTLPLVINIIMVGKWFLIIQQWIFIIHQLVYGIIDMMTNTISKATLQSYLTCLYHYLMDLLFLLTFFKDILLLNIFMTALFGGFGASGELVGVDTASGTITTHELLFNCAYEYDPSYRIITHIQIISYCKSLYNKL